MRKFRIQLSAAACLLLGLILLLLWLNAGPGEPSAPALTADDHAPSADIGIEPLDHSGFPAPRSGSPNGSNYSSGTILVRFAPDTAEDRIRASIRAVGARLAARYRTPGLVLVELPASLSPEEARGHFTGVAEVESVEFDFYYYTREVPNDPDFEQLWGLRNHGQEGGTVGVDIAAKAAWIEARGDPQFVVAVIDSGVDLEHPDLHANLWVNDGEIPGNGIDDDGNGYVDDIHGVDARGADSVPDDLIGHGTHVGGTIGAVGDNGIGVTGVLWESSVLHCKVFSEFGYTELSWMLRCFDYLIAASDAGVKLVAVNASWGGEGYSELLYDAIAALGQRDIILVAAAGNDGLDSDVNPDYPASYDLDNVIAVAAIDRTGALARFSNYGRTSIDIAAPGVRVYSTDWSKRYSFKSGTSMAAPHVTGALALIKSATPEMTMMEIRDHLLATSVSVDSLTDITVSGRRLSIELPLIDLDGDGISDRWEARFGLDAGDPADAVLDPDGDGLDNLTEFQRKTYPNQADTDGDGLDDGVEADVHGTDPTNPDSDGDGLSDGDEIGVHGTDANASDSDGDGLSDPTEISDAGTDPIVADTDGDGLLDGFEVIHGMNPLAPGERDLDLDGDALANHEEQLWGTDPLNADSDADGATDGEEANALGTDPLHPDSDGDDIDDGWEASAGLDPLDASDARADADGDGYSNREEFRNDSDARDEGSIPAFRPWQGFQGNGGRTGYVPIHTDEADFRLRWMGTVPGRRALPMVVTRHGIYAYWDDDQYYISRIDTLDGREAWRRPLGNSGLTTVPMIDRDNVVVHGYLPSNSGKRHQLWSLWPLSGKKRFTVPSPWTSPETLDRREVIIAPRERDGAAQDTGYTRHIVGISPRTGEERWRSEPLPAPYYRGMLAANASYVAFVSAGRLQVVARGEGTLALDLELPGCGGFLADQNKVLVDERDMAVVLCFRIAYGVDLNLGTVLWEVGEVDNRVRAALDARHLYAAGVTGLLAFDVATGELVWKVESSGLYDAEIAVTLDHLFVNRSGRIAAFDLATRDLVWLRDLGDEVEMSLNSDGTLVVSEGRRIAVYDVAGDRDDDGVDDWWESYHGLGLADPSDAGEDADGDGLSNAEEFVLQSDPKSSDTDGDGLTDGDEHRVWQTDIDVADSDGDGLADGIEVMVWGTDPARQDTDSDRIADGDEVGHYGTDPKDQADAPARIIELTESFESGLPHGWRIPSDAVGGFSVTAMDASDGLQALISDETDRGNVAIERLIDFAGGEFSVDVLTPAPRAGKLKIFVDGDLVAYLGSPEWQTYRGSLLPGRRTIRFEFGSQSTGTDDLVLIDNLRFEPVPPFGASPNGVLVMMDNELREFDGDGNRVRAPLRIPGAVEARDLVVTPDYRFAIYDAPNIHLLDPVLGTHETIRIDGLGRGYFLDAAPIATLGDSILVGDLDVELLWKLDSFGQRRRVVYRGAVGSLQRGADGMLYGKYSLYSPFVRIDPTTLETQGPVPLDVGDARNLHATSDGDLYTATYDRRIVRYDNDSARLDVERLYMDGRPHDLARGHDGRLFVGATDSELVIVEPNLAGHRVFDVTEQAYPGHGNVFVATLPRTGRDSDGDGMPDWWEITRGLDHRAPEDGELDRDGDGLRNRGEYNAGTDIDQRDTDGDGLNDAREVRRTGTNPLQPDSDRDGLDDRAELESFGSNPLSSDTDGDGLDDGWEIRRYGSDPLSSDTDGDGMPDGYEFEYRLRITDPRDGRYDPDGDGLTNRAEFAAGTRVDRADSDGDGLSDADELRNAGTDPLASDTDGDHLRDGWEARFGFDPLSSHDERSDPDGDGYSNLAEFYAMTSPRDPIDRPVPRGWSTHQGDGRHTGFVPVQLNPSEFRFLWQTDLLDGRESGMHQVTGNWSRSVAVTNRRTTPEPSLIAGLDPVTGAVAWRVDLSWNAFLSMATVAGDTAYLQSGGYESTFLLGLGLADGRSLFRNDYGDALPLLNPAPLYADRSLFHSDGRVWRFDATTGDAQWFSRIPELSHYELTAGHREMYLFGSGDSPGVHVVDPETGRVRYTLPVGSLDSPRAAAILGGRGNIIQAGGGGIVSIDLEDRSVVWENESNTFQPSALGRGVLFHPEVRYVVATDERDGEELWRWYSERIIRSNLLATEHLVFAATRYATHALDALTGEEVWSYPAGGMLSIGSDLTLYIAGENGLVTAIATQPDADGDRFPDSWEVTHGLDPDGFTDGTEDDDGDGVNLVGEYLARSDPTVADSDGDGLTDGEELAYGTNPLSIDTDDDGLDDAEERAVTLTSAVLADSDEDGLDDGAEVREFGTDPRATDTDGDGFGDSLELKRRSDPTSPDSVPRPVAKFFESFETGTLPPEFENGHGGVHRWRLRDSTAADGRLAIGAEYVGADQTATLGWEDNFNEGVLTFYLFQKDGPCYGQCNDTKLSVDGIDVPLAMDYEGWGRHDVPISAGRHVVVWHYEHPVGFYDEDDGMIDQVSFDGPDADGDGLPTVWESAHGLDPDDAADASADSDSDGLSSRSEYDLGTSPTNPDSDYDGMPDGWERDRSLDPLVDDAAADPDGDGVDNLTEHRIGTLPLVADSDEDGMPDGWETAQGFDPLSPDAASDADGDGSSNLEEYVAGTDPTDPDSSPDPVPPPGGDGSGNGGTGSGGGTGAGGGAAGSGKSGGASGGGGGPVGPAFLLLLLAGIGPRRRPVL